MARKGCDMNSDEVLFEKNDYLTWKKLDASRSVMLDLNSGHYYTLNETATTAWEALASRRPITAAAWQIACTFDVAPSEAERDVRELAAFLSGKGFLRQAAAGAEAGQIVEAAAKPELKPYAKPLVEEHEAVQEIAAAGSSSSSCGSSSHYWYPN